MIGPLPGISFEFGVGHRSHPEVLQLLCSKSSFLISIDIDATGIPFIPSINFIFVSMIKKESYDQYESFSFISLHLFFCRIEFIQHSKEASGEILHIISFRKENYDWYQFFSNHFLLKN